MLSWSPYTSYTCITAPCTFDAQVHAKSLQGLAMLAVSFSAIHNNIQISRLRYNPALLTPCTCLFKRPFYSPLVKYRMQALSRNKNASLPGKSPPR